MLEAMVVVADILSSLLVQGTALLAGPGAVGGLGGRQTEGRQHRDFAGTTLDAAYGYFWLQGKIVSRQCKLDSARLWAVGETIVLKTPPFMALGQE